MADIFFNLSPIRKLTLAKTNNSRAYAFFAAVLRSTFRKRHYAAVFKQWFNWVSWKKGNLLNPDFTPLIVTHSEFRRAQVLKTIKAWCFISWSSYCSKMRKQKQRRAVMVQLSLLRRLRSAIIKLNKTSALMHACNVMLSKFFSAHRMHFLIQAFRAMRALWRASRLQKLHNFRLMFTRHNHWKNLCLAKRDRWNRYYACSLLLKYIRTWRTLLSVKRMLVMLHSRVLVYTQTKCVVETLSAWSVWHFKRKRAIRMHEVRLSKQSIQHWLLESVIRKRRRLAEIKIQCVFKHKRIRSAICVISSWANKSRRNHDFVISKQLVQRSKELKSTIFRGWAIYAFRKRNVAYQNSLTKRIKLAVTKNVRSFFVCWWIQMKQVARANMSQKCRLFNFLRMTVQTWRIVTRQMALFCSNNTAVLIRRRSRRFTCLIFALWKIVCRQESRKKNILRHLNARLFHLSRIFIAFLASCRLHRDQLRLFSHHSIVKLCLHAWSQRSQQSSMLQCTRFLLMNMRNVRQRHTAVTNLYQMIKHRDLRMYHYLPKTTECMDSAGPSISS